MINDTSNILTKVTPFLHKSNCVKIFKTYPGAGTMLIKKYYTDIIEFKAAQSIFGWPIYLTHFYYFDGILIDTGPSHTASEVLNALRSLPIDKVLITHRHEDHTGNSALIKEALNIPVYAHQETIKVLENPPDIEIYRKIMWGNMRPAKALPVEAIIKSNRHEIQAIHTAGHSKDHMCYFEPENRLLFAGDFYLGENLNGFMVGENIVEHLEGLKRLISLQPKTLFCGLKGRLDNATERLSRKYDSWWELGCRVRDMHNAGATRRKILKEAFGGEIFFFYFSQSNWGRRYMLDTIMDNLSYFQPGNKKEFLPYD